MLLETYAKPTGRLLMPCWSVAWQKLKRVVLSKL
jgi:hypothetical protein